RGDEKRHEAGAGEAGTREERSMCGRKRGGRGCWLLALLALAATAPHGRTQQAADTTEIRDFVVQVDGKQAGNTQLAITQRQDGTTQVSAKANVQVKLFLTYTYAFQGTEVWKGGQLLKLTGQCNDN